MSLRKRVDAMLAQLDALAASYNRQAVSFAAAHIVEGVDTSPGRSIAAQLRGDETKLLNHLSEMCQQVHPINQELARLTEARSATLDRQLELNDPTRLDSVLAQIETQSELTFVQRIGVLRAIQNAAAILADPRGNVWTGGYPPQPPAPPASGRQSPRDDPLDDLLGYDPR
jgi:hypothetical protein